MSVVQPFKASPEVKLTKPTNQNNQNLTINAYFFRLSKIDDKNDVRMTQIFLN